MLRSSKRRKTLHCGRRDDKGDLHLSKTGSVDLKLHIKTCYIYTSIIIHT